MSIEHLGDSSSVCSVSTSINTTQLIVLKPPHKITLVETHKLYPYNTYVPDFTLKKVYKAKRVQVGASVKYLVENDRGILTLVLASKFKRVLKK